ncbi:hypothetical protein GALMADRAFT_787210 [Galerina marginata CBS 339.88]|uniref:Uncharacterized protein n=1 Tax=Galerina marginata (strain CBS 339.88) TaxID=685588 RepID=A0A067SXM0_GALM3|nr:hypothetical protein GALMADRAFT_787210 [Galerina marginata CBS 339.88]
MDDARNSPNKRVFGAGAGFDSGSGLDSSPRRKEEGWDDEDDDQEPGGHDQQYQCQYQYGTSTMTGSTTKKTALNSAASLIERRRKTGQSPPTPDAPLSPGSPRPPTPRWTHPPHLPSPVTASRSCARPPPHPRLSPNLNVQMHNPFAHTPLRSLTSSVFSVPNTIQTTHTYSSTTHLTSIPVR